MRVTEKKIGVQLTGRVRYCAGCAKTMSYKASKPLELFFVDLGGPMSVSVSESKYCVMVVDDYSNFGWTLILKEKSAAAVAYTFLTFCVALRPLIQIRRSRFHPHGQRHGVRQRGVQGHAGTVWNHSAADVSRRPQSQWPCGAKASIGCHFPDVAYQTRALNYSMTWPEAWKWTVEALNISARVDDKSDMPSPHANLFGQRRPPGPALSFMMSGYRQVNRASKAYGKGELCFHSS